MAIRARLSALVHRHLSNQEISDSRFIRQLLQLLTHYPENDDEFELKAELRDFPYAPRKASEGGIAEKPFSFKI